MLQYHNITPAHFFAPYDAAASSAWRRWAGASSRRSSATSTWRWATPSTTGRNSRRSGSRRPACCRSVVDTARITDAPRRPALEKVLDDGLTNFLFVGPHRAEQEDRGHIRLAELYKRYVDTYYRFIFVGKHDAVPAYYATIRALMARVPDAGRTGSGSPARCPTRTWRRSTARRRAYISLSEHEGFCVPLVEAMAADVPSWPTPRRRVPETLGGAGCASRRRTSSTPRNCSACWPSTSRCGAKIIEGQRARLAAFGDDRLRAGLHDMIAAFD